MTRADAPGKRGAVFTDLDGTLIFSARLRSGGDIIIERKDGEPISCITARQAELLRGARGVIPVTTRSVEQYRRIDFSAAGFRPRYALCANGGVLLENGEPDAEWNKWSEDIFRRAQRELSVFRELLCRDGARSFEVRTVDGLFLFTKSSAPQETLERLAREFPDSALCETFYTGEKVYVVPRELNKGAAAARLAERLGIAEYAAAGDSLMDLPLLNSARRAVFTDNIPEELVTAPEKLMRPREGFAEFTAQFIREYI